MSTTTTYLSTDWFASWARKIADAWQTAFCACHFSKRSKRQLHDEKQGENVSEGEQEKKG